MENHRMVRAIEGGIAGKLPETVTKPSESNLLALDRWLVRNDARFTSLTPYLISSAADTKAEHESVRT